MESTRGEGKSAEEETVPESRAELRLKGLGKPGEGRGSVRADGFASPREEEKLTFGGQVQTFVDGVESQFQTV